MAQPLKDNINRSLVKLLAEKATEFDADFPAERFVNRHDPSETVRRSVANHLNDVAKANPGLVVDVLKGWSARDPSRR